MKLNYGQLIGYFTLFWLFVILNYYGYPFPFQDDPGESPRDFWHFLCSFWAFCLDGCLLVWVVFKVSCIDFWQKEINLNKIKK